MTMSAWMAAAVLLDAGVGGAPQASAPSCTVPSAVVRVADLPEGSGIAASAPGRARFWAHNDSGKPELIALDAEGKSIGRVAVTGGMVEDWEAITVARCGSDTCLYVGDIGDNDARRKDITIYRVDAPESGSGRAKVTKTFRATYPDGAHDAEALLASPDGTLHIVTKGETGAVALYRFPRELGDGVMRLERVGKPLTPGKVAVDQRVTDAAISHDGRWVALRSKTSVRLYPAAAFLEGRFDSARTIDLRKLGEPQGEAIAFDRDGNIIVAGEGGGKGQAGTFAVLSCR